MESSTLSSEAARTSSDSLGSGAMFDRIAHRYDLLNRILSLGGDSRWRRRTVDALRLPSNARVLDLATGTADLALEVLRRHPDATVVGTDPSTRMLEIARDKARDAGLADRVELEEGVAEQLPFGDDTFDGVCIAFGIRNVPDRAAALREMARVTRSSGRVAILELGEPHSGILAPLARLHVRHVVPRIGALLSGEREYRYLQESIEAFPSPADFAELMEASGLAVRDVEPLSFGACNLFVGQPVATAREAS